MNDVLVDLSRVGVIYPFVNFLHVLQELLLMSCAQRCVTSHGRETFRDFPHALLFELFLPLQRAVCYGVFEQFIEVEVVLSQEIHC